MDGLTGKIEEHKDGQRLLLSGCLNENASAYLQQIVPQLGSRVSINFRDVKSVNSFGVHAWMSFLGKVAQGRSIFFEECTPEIVAQINMMPLFKRGAVIESVYAEYTCQSCGHEERRLFVRGENMPGPGQAPVESQACGKCGKKTEMDQEFSDFFMFLCE